MKDNKGFSLVELIVVIAIMAILAAVAVVSYSVYIERAQNAADEQYLKDVQYFAELYAMEHQLELDKVIVAPVVDSADDIKLVINNQTTGEKETIIAEEIFQSVGNKVFGSKYNNGMYDPNEPGIDIPESSGGQQSHTPHAWQEEVCDPTCCKEGYVKRVCDCGAVEVERLPMTEHDYLLKTQKGDFAYYVCQDCGKIIIKSSNGNLPLVPIG